MDELIVHARTKEDGYRPPARWEWIAEIREVVKLPIIANGEVWTRTDYLDIRRVTGCPDVMLGRGAVADPLLAARIRNDKVQDPIADWEAVKHLIACFWGKVQAKVLPHQSPGRLKQWLGLMRRSYPQADTLYQEVRALHCAADVSRVLTQTGACGIPC
jgi:tRNA-dihydrouridine synthase C